MLKGWLSEAGRELIKTIEEGFSSLCQILMKILKRLCNIIVNIGIWFRKTWQAIKRAVRKTWRVIKRVARKTWRAIQKAVRKTWRVIKRVARKTWRKCKQLIKKLLGWITTIGVFAFLIIVALIAYPFFLFYIDRVTWEIILWLLWIVFSYFGIYKVKSAPSAKVKINPNNLIREIIQYPIESILKLEISGSP